MGTKFNEIYERAIFKFNDYSHLEFSNKIKETIFLNLLKSAIVDFTHSSQQSLLYKLNENDIETGNGDDEENLENMQDYEFENDLSNEEQEILALGVVFHWLSNKAMNSELMRNILHNKDYTSYSPGNLLRELKELRKAIKQEYVGKINVYSFRNSSIQNLTPRVGG